jgi:hypothetical protein
MSGARGTCSRSCGGSRAAACPTAATTAMSDWEAMRVAEFNDTLVGERV